MFDSNEKEWTVDNHNNIDELHRYYAEHKKVDKMEVPK